MDFYDRASKWAESRIKDIGETADRLLSGNVDFEDLEFVLHTALLFIEPIVDSFAPGQGEVAEQIKLSIKDQVDDLVRFVAAVVSAIVPLVNESIAGLAPKADPEISTDLEMRADAEQAAAAIEELTAELEVEMSEEQGRAEQETAALEEKFKAEQDEMAGKLDKMRDRYFENHPDLDKDQRADAEQTFKTIKDDAVEALKAQQDSRLVELQDRQQDQRDDYEKLREELDGTRDQRG